MSRRRRSMRVIAPVVAAATLTVTAGAAAAQSLGELARQEEERRKAIKSSGKVYTNETLRPAPGAPSGSGSATAVQNAPASGPAAAPSPSGVEPAPPAAPAAQAPATAPPAAPAAGAARDEAYWKQRMQQARDTLQRAQVFAEALQSRINALTADFTARDDPAQRDGIAADRQKALAELDRVKQEIAEQTKTIAAIQDEARRAGVPPGWLR